MRTRLARKARDCPGSSQRPDGQAKQPKVRVLPVGTVKKSILISGIGFTGTMLELPRFGGKKTFPAIGQKGYPNA
jgi:hypothetical protein